MPEQLLIDFNPDTYSQYGSCLEFIVDDDVPRLCRDPRILKKSIAADMDYAPSQFTNKLNRNEGARFTLDDLELYIQKTGSVEPVRYLVHRYLVKQSPAAIQKQIDELKLLKQELEVAQQ